VNLRKLARRPYAVYVRARHGRRGVPTVINHEPILLHPDCRGVAAWAPDRTTRLHEPEFWRLLDIHVRPDDVVADVGANVGLYTIAFARRLTTGRVYAFEPDPASLEWLRFHLRVNGVVGRVEVVEAAAGDQNGTVGFAVRGVVTSSIAGLWDDPGREEQPVRQVRLDSVLERLDVLKVDVEGYEGQVLQGCLASLHPRVILLEVHPELLPNAGYSVTQLREMLTSRGYAIEDIPTKHAQVHWLVTDRT
jgi:FkbM family methyltransferase